MRRPHEAVEWLAAIPSRTGLFSDFDGTLSPIARRPEDARPLPGASDVLRRLAARLALVGIVSGRPAAWLVEHAGADLAAGGVEIYGLHGVEHVAGDSIEVATAARAFEEAAAAVGREAEAAGVPGLRVEDKRFGVTLHWRDASDPSAVAREAEPLAARLAAEGGFATRPGKASVELVAPIGVDKGSIVAGRAVADGLQRVGFIGDDTSDVAAFVAVDELVAAGRASGLKVAVSGPEAPAALIERADLVLASPAEVLQLLGELADRLEAVGG